MSMPYVLFEQNQQTRLSQTGSTSARSTCPLRVKDVWGIRAIWDLGAWCSAQPSCAMGRWDGSRYDRTLGINQFYVDAAEPKPSSRCPALPYTLHSILPVPLRRARREVALIGSRYPPRSYHTPWCVACWSTQRHHGPHDSWSLPSAVRLHPLSLDSIGRSVLVNSIPRQSTSQPRHLITHSPTVSRARFIQDASQGEEN